MNNLILFHVHIQIIKEITMILLHYNKIFIEKTNSLIKMIKLLKLHIWLIFVRMLMDINVKIKRDKQFKFYKY